MTDVTGFADQLLTVHDAALMLACSVAEVRRLRADGELFAFYVGTEAMFRWANVRSLQRRQEEMARLRSSRRNRVFGTGMPQRRVVGVLASDTAILGEG
jgi:hypothetical protein